MKEAVTRILNKLTQEDFQGAFQKLLKRYNKCIDFGGEYFEGDYSFLCVRSIKVPIQKKSGNLLNAPRNNVHEVNVKIVDGATLVHLLEPKKSTITVKTFQDYAYGVFLPYIERMLQHVCVDIVWDVHRDDSLKAYTLQNSGTGRRIRVANNTSILANWKNFFSVDANKDALFKFLAATTQELTSPQGKQIISTHGQNVVSSPITDLSMLYRSHEEADTQLIFHASHAFRCGFSKMMIHATDIDVVVLGIASVSKNFENCELWMAFGHGSRVRYILCHLITAELGSVTSDGLLFMHAISGCDICVIVL